MKPDRAKVGLAGEIEALLYLKKKGYRITAKNYKTKIGEIDIIARRGNLYVFVEVRTRSNDSFCNAQETINSNKQKKIIAASLCYIKENEIVDKDIRFDVITFQNGRIEHFEDAFSTGGEFIV